MRLAKPLGFASLILWQQYPNQTSILFQIKYLQEGQ
jgi:hypothetical protein